jgi:hypothetical protein
VQRISGFSIEGVYVTRAILGCDSFISWLYQNGDSQFKGSNGRIDFLKTFEVAKTSVDCGVRSIDLSPPLVDVFKRLRKESREKIEGLGALQEWVCTNFTIDSVPLADYADEVKASMCSILPSSYLRDLKRSAASELGFARSFFLPKSSAQPLTISQIDSIRMKPEFFEKRLKLYRNLDVKLIQFGGITADWLVALGRVDLLENLTRLIRKCGLIPLLVCHWTSLVLPRADRELDVAGYIVPINKLWSLLSRSEALDVMRKIRKPVIAMKPLAQGVLAHDIEGAFTFLFKKARVNAVLVGISSVSEAKQTFLILSRIDRR